MSEIVRVQKIGVFMLIVSGMAVGISIYRFANTLNVVWAIAVVLWIYNAWDGYRRIVRWLSEPNVELTVNIPRRDYLLNREEMLN